ncbi:MAG: hypothetical protein ABL879_06205 [Devosia sp.]
MTTEHQMTEQQKTDHRAKLRAARNAIRHKRGKFRTVAKKKVRVTLPMGDRRRSTTK